MVVSKGTRVSSTGTRRRYRCRPKVGKEHTFSLIDGPIPMPVHSPPPSCPEHPGSKVVRNGFYATSTTKPRQMYRCFPDGGGRVHAFVPKLARDHVHTGEDSCSVCEELRGTHRGDRTVARRHSWSARLVADALKDLAEGKSYAAVGREMRRATGRTRTRAVVPAQSSGAAPRVKSAGSALSANAWHVAADWVEVFSPVLWADLEPRMVASDLRDRDRADAELATGGPMSEPMVLLLDEIPIAVGHRRGYAVLVAAQVVWSAPRQGGAKTDRQVRLRLLRGYPSQDHYAWKLVFHELGYRPDFVLADRGRGIVKAVAETWGDQVPVLPSLFHMREAVERALLKTPGTRRDAGSKQPNVGVARLLQQPFEAHLRDLSRAKLSTMTVEEWQAWWTRLDKLLTDRALPLEKLDRLRAEYVPLVADLLPVYRAYPQLPVSTGGLEVALRQRVGPVLKGRQHAFANLERVNRLFDLVVCRDWAMFDDTLAVADLIRTDNERNHGWATPLRDVSDIRVSKTSRYSSLRDQQLLRSRARELGLV